MYYFLTASKDASIFQQQPTQNTGLDEVLEVSKVYYGSLKDIARSLIKFDLNTLSQSLYDGDVTMSVAELVLRETETNEIPLSYSLEINPVSQSWEMGIGTRFDDISSEGCTWNYRASGSDWLQLMYLIVEVQRVHSMVKVGCGTPHHKLLVIMIMNLPI